MGGPKKWGVLLALLAGWSSTCFPQAGYVPIPPGFDFPARSEVLLAAVKAGDQAALRRHGWMVFAGLTQPARSNDPASEAVWETWYSGAETFQPAAPSLEAVRPLQRRFTVPRQFQRAGGPSLEAVGASALSFTLFNRELREHTQGNRLQMAETLEKINDKWTDATPLGDRKIPDYKAEAMSIKVVWKLVKKTGLTALPVWDEQPRVSIAPEQPEDTWARLVAVDPSRDVIPSGEKRDVKDFQGKTFKGARVVSLKSFYHFKLTAQQASQANATLNGAGDAQAGDFVALVAMHYTTKEIPNWVWATFWWHDMPDASRFAAGKLDDTRIRGPWRNYLMDVAFDMELPREADGTPVAVFNPYLEARFANGVNSNCMACHQRAVWSKQQPAPAFLPVTRGPAKPDDPRFIRGTTVDFLWSLLFEGNQ